MKKTIMIPFILSLILSLAACADPQDIPVPAAADPAEQKLAALMEQMSTEEKIGQLFMVRTSDLDPGLSLGGAVLFAGDFNTPEDLRSKIEKINSCCETGMFIGIDEEGGRVARIAKKDAFDVPRYESMLAVGSSGNPEDARLAGFNIGSYLHSFGVNVDFAPDADVFTNPKNKVIGDRAFSTDPQIAADMVSACVKGFHESGTICCIKHFPGHGDTISDTHDGSVSVVKTWEEMQQCEMLPFMAGISAGADMVMVAHVDAVNVSGDGLPASLSAEMITGKLRGELGFDGVVITDALEMKAINDEYGIGNACLMAFEAGADILLMPLDIHEAYNALLDAAVSGRISAERLDQSVERILKLKIAYGIIPAE